MIVGQSEPGEVAVANQQARRFTVMMGGRAVGPGRVAVRDVVEIVRRSEQALKRVGQVLYGEESKGKGRKPREIEQLCSLYLVSWETGSAIAGLELAEPPPQLSLFGYVGENSLKAFLEGLDVLSGTGLRAERLPAGFDTGVLEACEGLAAVLDHGIDALTFSAPGIAEARTAVFDPATRERVRSLLRGPLDLGRTSKVGRLEELNGHRGLSGRLWEADGTHWICAFKPEHIDVLAEAWLKTVTIIGEAKLVEKAREGTFKVGTILIHETSGERSLQKEEGSPFWKSLSLEELVQEREVGPVADLAELAAAWPAEEALDDPLGELLADRAARRRAAEKSAG